MIENTIFDHVQQHGLIVGSLNEQEFISAVKEIADEAIDGSNVKQACVFATQMYRYCIRNNKTQTVLERSEFGNVLGVYL